MKKTLLASTALVAVGALAAAPASAAEKINVSVGGYMQQWFGWAENDSPAENGFDQKNDTEIHFKGSTVLDNGLEIGIQVELEGQTEGDQIDESYLWVEGGFGRLVMGKENGANYLMHYAPIEAGIGMNSGDISNSNDGSTAWIANTTGANFYNGIGTTFARTVDNDHNKITYFTPRFAGFQFGASYTPEQQADNDNARGMNNVNYEDGLSFGLNYDQKFNDFRVQASAGYFHADGQNGFEDAESHNWGLRLGYGGFTLAGSAAFYEKGQNGVNNFLEGQTYNAGIHWANGPLAASFSWLYGEQEGQAGGGDDELQAFMLSMGYTLGPGVEVRASAFHGEWEAEAGAGGGTDNDGFGVVAGFNLSF